MFLLHASLDLKFATFLVSKLVIFGLLMHEMYKNWQAIVNFEYFYL